MKNKTPENETPVTKSTERRNKKINQSDTTLTFADKSYYGIINHYRLIKEGYVEMRRNSITSTFKKIIKNIK